MNSSAPKGERRADNSCCKSNGLSGNGLIGIWPVGIGGFTFLASRAVHQPRSSLIEPMAGQPELPALTQGS